MSERKLFEALNTLPRQMIVIALRGQWATLPSVSERHWTDPDLIEAVRLQQWDKVKEILAGFARDLKGNGPLSIELATSEFMPTEGIETLAVTEARGRYDMKLHKTRKTISEGIYDQHRAVIDASRLMYPPEYD